MTTAIALSYFAGFVGFVATMACVYGRKARVAPALLDDTLPPAPEVVICTAG